MDLLLEFAPFRAIREGGWMMYLLLGVSIVGLYFTIERFLALKRLRQAAQAEDLVNRISILYREKGREKATRDSITLCEENKSPVSNILKAGIQTCDQCLSKGMDAKDARTAVEKAVTDTAGVEIPLLETHLPVLETVAKVAPLMGLLGTILGMIQAFNQIAMAPGGVKPNDLAGGIKVALYTTAFGLIISVPTIIIYNILRTIVDNYVFRTEVAALDLADTLLGEAK